VNRKSIILVGMLALLVAQLACTVGETPAKPTLDATDASTVVAPRLPTSAPAPTATATENLAPTALPAPTQIQPPTDAPTVEGTVAEGGQPTSGGPVLSMTPAVGEPGDVIMVNGTGWPPEAHVVLAWGAPGGSSWPSYWELDADASGNFTVGLKVPPADKWPGGPPKDRTLFQLRAMSEATDPYYYWANFTYIKRFVPPTMGSPIGPSPTPKPTNTPTPTP
jgi:hypothetical protein